MLHSRPRLGNDEAPTIREDIVANEGEASLVERPVQTAALSGFGLLTATATFRPYGDRLLSPAGAGWLLIVTVLVFIMASAEGIAWGRMMSQLSEGPLMPFVGFAAGLAVFVIVWGIDATLMTLDVAAPSVERRLYGRSASPWGARLSLVGGYLLRIGIVCGSLWLTAPQLADMLFTTDIEHLVELKRKRLIDEVRSDVASRGQPREESLRQQLWDDRNLLEDELAGRSSGRRGYGPIARTIEARIASAEAELVESSSAREAELADLQQALQTDDGRGAAAPVGTRSAHRQRGRASQGPRGTLGGLLVPGRRAEHPGIPDLDLRLVVRGQALPATGHQDLPVRCASGRVLPLSRRGVRRLAARSRTFDEDQASHDPLPIRGI